MFAARPPDGPSVAFTRVRSHRDGVMRGHAPPPAPNPTRRPLLVVGLHARPADVGTRDS